MVESMLWFPEVELSEAERKVATRAAKKRKLFVFLREHRHELFDEGFQQELLEMYRQTGAGKSPLPPAKLALVTLLQAYTGVADHEAVELTADSKRWQLVLGCLEAEEALCAQSTLYDFRLRLISTGMDRRLLERTVELARSQGGFSARALRAALDSSPLWGHGRVEDTVNLLGRAGRKVIACMAELTRHTVAEVAAQMGLSLFEAPSLKAALDVDWTDPAQKAQALQRLIDELEALQVWIGEHLALERAQPPLQEALATLQRLMAQDLEPDPEGGRRLRRGVAKDRQISVEDPEMRHGRKSAQHRFDGYKRHIARDLDEHVIVAAEVLAANTPDTAGLEPLLAPLPEQGRELTELHIDRGYLGHERIAELDAQGVAIVCKPWNPANGRGRLSKRDFPIDLEQLTATCPAGQVVSIAPGKVVHFPASACAACPLRARCTTGQGSTGRSLTIHPHEDLLQRLAALPTTAEGRAALRERVDVEHGLAHVAQRQGNHARFNGTRKNTYHLRLVCALQNLERAQALAQPQHDECQEDERLAA